jgi:L-ascorbate metabolism protein UlaG (beta-lactamase superfamily)
MRLTKFEHACMILELDGEKLIIDPGNFTPPLVDVTHVAAVVVTHEHPDHWMPEHLRAIRAANPDVPIFGPQGLATAAAEFGVTVVGDGATASAGPFELRFVGEKHAEIHSSIPVIDNTGVLVNETLFYPGDAFTLPGVPVKVLAAPAAAPWLKIAEAMDYVAAVAPARAFPVHQMVLSVLGQQMHHARLSDMTEKAGGEFFVLEPGESREV